MSAFQESRKSCLLSILFMTYTTNHYMFDHQHQLCSHNYNHKYRSQLCYDSFGYIQMIHLHIHSHLQSKYNNSCYMYKCSPMNLLKLSLTSTCYIVIHEFIAIETEAVMRPMSVVANLLTAVCTITALINIYIRSCSNSYMHG